MDDGVRLRTVPPKNLNGDTRQHRCSDSVEIRVDAACPLVPFKIVEEAASLHVRCPMWVRNWLRRYDEGGLKGHGS